MDNVNQALAWLVKKFEKHHIPFQIVGGLAAKAYGSKREVVDIDMYIPHKYFKKFPKELKKFIVWGPKHFKDNCWDVIFLRIIYEDQKIEIADAKSSKIYDKKIKKWICIDIDFSDSVIKKVFEMNVPVIPKQKLIKYKKILSREVDILDLKEIV